MARRLSSGNITDTWHYEQGYVGAKGLWYLNGQRETGGYILCVGGRKCMIISNHPKHYNYGDIGANRCNRGLETSLSFR